MLRLLIFSLAAFQHSVKFDRCRVQSAAGCSRFGALPRRRADGESCSEDCGFWPVQNLCITYLKKVTFVKGFRLQKKANLFHNYRLLTCCIIYSYIDVLLKKKQKKGEIRKITIFLTRKQGKMLVDN
jgi:hypothetical protein